MKRLPVIILLVTLLPLSLLAQSVSERISLSGGDQLWVNLMQQMYLYPEFREGTVEYKTGERFKRMMNFNRMLSAVQFIEKADTLAVANEQNVSQIIIGNDVFVYGPACMQAIATHKNVTLFKNEAMRIADVRQVGALGRTNSTAGIDTHNQLYNSISAYRLNVNETLLLNKTTTFYIRKENGEYVPASRKNVLKMFPGEGNAIKEFIDSKNIRFTKESDLVELTNYIAGL